MVSVRGSLPTVLLLFFSVSSILNAEDLSRRAGLFTGQEDLLGVIGVDNYRDDASINHDIQKMACSGSQQEFF